MFHSVHRPPSPLPFAGGGGGGGVEPPTKFFQKGRGWGPSPTLNFILKSKLKFEIFNGKKC